MHILIYSASFAFSAVNSMSSFLTGLIRI